MSAFVEHVRVEVRSTLRNPSQLLMAWLFPLGFALVLGGVMPELNPAFGAGMVSAFAVIAVTTGTLLGQPGPMVEARSAGVLRGFRVVGVPDWASLVVPGLSTAIHAVLAAIVTATMTVAVYQGEAPTHPLAFVGVVALATFAFAGIGALIGVVSASTRATVLLSQALFLPSMLLGGMMVPWAALPEGARRASLWLPTTHVMQLLDGLAYDRATALPLWAHAAGVAGAGLVAWVLAVALFDTEPREVRSWTAIAVLAALLPLGAGALAM